jgi:RimJ/RimL family protein N-acetyltransferase
LTPWEGMPRNVSIRAVSDEAGRRFLAGRGFVVATTVRVSEVDPRSVAETPRLPAGFESVPLHEAAGGVEQLFEVYSQARADIPSKTPRPVWSLSEWRAQTLDHPLLDLDASVVVSEQGEPVSLAWLYSDREGGRAEALMAATRRDGRGLGLATLAKLELTPRAAELGIIRFLTSNDLDNAAMLAINRKIGFTPTRVVRSCAKSLSKG